jgi:dolichol kinase
MDVLVREMGRKAFHMLSLIYLAAYHFLGYPRVLFWMAAWATLVLLLESGRLLCPAFNEFLLSLFAGIARDQEARSFSGIFHTTLGALILMAGFGTYPRIVFTSLFYVALGDAAAALVGKGLGRRLILGGKKSLEGSLACFLVCAALGWTAGFSAASCVLSAMAATIIEIFPTTRFFNDNLWMPVATALVLRLVP